MKFLFQFSSHQNRPTAYNHLKPYQRLNSFLRGMLYKINEDIKEATAEIKMWQEPEVKAILGEEDLDRVIELGEAKAYLEKLQTELKRWTEMAEKMHYCYNCNGCGEYWESRSQDESVRRQCLVCKGTGVNPETAQDAPPVPAPKKKLLPGILESIGRKFR